MKTILAILLTAASLYSAPLVGVTNGSKVTFFDSQTPGSLDAYSGDNTGSQTYKTGYSVFDEQGRRVGDLIDITVDADGSFYGLTQSGTLYKFVDFGKYQNNELGFKMTTVKTGIAAGNGDFSSTGFSVLANGTFYNYDLSFNLASQQAVGSFSGLAIDNGNDYSLKFSPSPSSLNVIGGSQLALVPNANQQSDLCGDSSTLFLTVNSKLYKYDNGQVTYLGNEAITLRSIDRIVPEPTTVALIGVGLAFMLWRRK